MQDEKMKEKTKNIDIRVKINPDSSTDCWFCEQYQHNECPGNRVCSDKKSSER